MLATWFGNVSFDVKFQDATRSPTPTPSMFFRLPSAMRIFVPAVKQTGGGGAVVVVAHGLQHQEA